MPRTLNVKCMRRRYLRPSATDPLGKPKGTLQKSKFDQHLVRIKELLSYGLSVRKIARVLGYSSHIALNTYINKRGLHEVAKA
jgi:hypothetical protein